MFSVFFRLFFCSLLFLYLSGRWRLIHHKTKFSPYVLRLVQPCFRPLRKTSPKEDLSILQDLSSRPTFFPPETSYYASFLKKKYLEEHRENNEEKLSSSALNVSVKNEEKIPVKTPHVSVKNEEKIPAKAPHVSVKNLPKERSGPPKVFGSTLHGVLWPEDAFPYSLNEKILGDSSFIKMLLSCVPPGTPLIFETAFWENTPEKSRVFNGLFSLIPYNSPDVIPESFVSSINIVHRKHHLVPFGEFLPLRNILGFLGLNKITGGSMDYSPGRPPKVYTPSPSSMLPPFLPLICSEGMFPHLSHHNDAQWILNLSTDGWYFHSFGPYQHVGANRFRAIEQGLPFVRVSLSGISCVIDPLGRLIVVMPYGVMASVDVLLPQGVEKGPYGHFGEYIDGFLFLLWFLFLGCLYYGGPIFLYSLWKKNEK